MWPAARTSSIRSPRTAPPASSLRSGCSTSRSASSASEHQQKILKGVLNLLQSRFLFRMGDAQDAEQATRIAMAVYSTMIRDDPYSRARLRVTPEQALNFPNYDCLASWIAHGTRAPSFMGETYPLPYVGDKWAEQHLAGSGRASWPVPRAARIDPRITRALVAAPIRARYGPQLKTRPRRPGATIETPGR